MPGTFNVLNHAGPCGSCCDCCVNPLPTHWSVDLTSLGLINGSCGLCESFNATYLMGNGGSGSTWGYSYPGFFCRLEDGSGQSVRMWVGRENYSDSVTWGGDGPFATLTRTPNTATGGCVWKLTWEIAAGCQYVGDEVFDPNCQGGSHIFLATWQYNSPPGQPCSQTKTLTKVSEIIQIWVDQYTCVNCDSTAIDLQNDPPENQETEGFLQSLGPFCTAGPNFPQTVTIVAS